MDTRNPKSFKVDDGERPEVCDDLGSDDDSYLNLIEAEPYKHKIFVLSQKRKGAISSQLEHVIQKHDELSPAKEEDLVCHLLKALDKGDTIQSANLKSKYLDLRLVKSLIGVLISW